MLPFILDGARNAHKVSPRPSTAIHLGKIHKLHVASDTISYAIHRQQCHIASENRVFMRRRSKKYLEMSNTLS